MIRQGSAVLRPQGGGVFRARSQFSPVHLFQGGENGYFAPIEPGNVFSDKATVAGIGDPVFCVFDKRLGVSFDGSAWSGLGSEIVPDPELNDVSWSNWNLGAGWSHNGTQLYYNGGGGWLRIENTFTAGEWYWIDLDLSVNSTGNFQIYSTSAWYVFPTTGTHRILWRAKNSTLQMWHGGSQVTIDRISIRHIPGNHLFQDVTASQGVLQAIPDPAQTSDQVVNGTFDADLSGWDFSHPAAATWDPSGKMDIEVVAVQTYARQTLTVEPGSRIEFSVGEITKYAGANNTYFYIWDVGGTQQTLDFLSHPGDGSGMSISGYAITDTVRVGIRPNGASNNGEGVIVDNVQILVTPPGGLMYAIKFDKVDDWLDFVTVPVIGSAAFSYRLGDGETAGLFINQGSGDYLGVFQDGSNLAVSADYVTSLVRVNGSALATQDRDFFFDAIAAAPNDTAVIYSEHSGSIPAGSVSRLGGYGASFYLGGWLFDALLVDRVLSATERGKLETWMAARSGVTLA